MLEGSVYEGLWKSLRKPHPLLLTEFGETGTRAHAVIVAQEKMENKNNYAAARPLKHFLLYEEQVKHETFQPDTVLCTNTDSSFTSKFIHHSNSYIQTIDIIA